MNADEPHITVDRVIPVFLGRDMEFILARLVPVPPARLLAVGSAEGDADNNEEDTAPREMTVVGRVRLDPEDAATLAIGILDLLASTHEVDLDQLEELIANLKKQAASAKESKH